MIPYRATLDVPAELLRYLSRLLAAERRRRGAPARSRKLTCRARRSSRCAGSASRPGRLAADHGISRATAYRYIDEAVDMLSAQAQGLDRAGGTGPRPRHRRRPRARPPSPVPAADLGMPTLADGGYEGAGIGIHVPVKNPGGNQRLDPDTKTRNSLLRGLRSQGERGFALLTQRWTALQRITASPRRTIEIVRAALVLAQFEHKYLN